jgi:hypothetical protein
VFVGEEGVGYKRGEERKLWRREEVGEKKKFFFDTKEKKKWYCKGCHLYGLN